MNIVRAEPLRYILLFIFIFIALDALHGLADPTLGIYHRLLAQSVCWPLNWFDPSVGCDGRYLLYKGASSLVIVPSCDGITLVALIFAAITPLPIPVREKLIGLAWLIPALLLANWARLIVLSAIKFYAPHNFDFFHVYLFQPVMIAFTLALFLWRVNYAHVRTV